MLFKIFPIKCRAFYKAIKYNKRYYLGKFLSYYNFLIIFSKEFAEEYKTLEYINTLNSKYINQWIFKINMK